ncbi:hypothetical protein BC940DRAFT_301926 [Gongronella butleri]|nr:hypothetical protein BC940DRAFT_301926 [Gongronella butleri]
MGALCQRLRWRYMKHAMLVKNCYPTADGETNPRAAELSYLTFYASARPGKLTKVSAYLCNKVRRDIRKGRKVNNKVSLMILKALIQVCHHDLSLFCRSTVVILQQMVDTRDIDLIDASCDTFYVFCSYFEGSSLRSDAAFTQDFQRLVKQFAAFAVYPNDDATLSLQIKYNGHRALAAIIHASNLNTSYTLPLLTHIVPPIHTTLAAANASAWDLAKGVASIDVRTGVFDVPELNLEWIERIAAQTLSTLCSLANGTCIRSTMQALLDSFDHKDAWWPTDKCTSIMNLVFQSVQPQYRYMLLSEILHQLERPSDTPNVSQDDRLAGLVACVRMILNSDAPLLGLSVLETLNTLNTYLMSSLARHGYLCTDDAAPSTSDQQVLKQYSIQKDLVDGIVGLASQSYYSNQWNDILGYFIGRLRVSADANGAIDTIPADTYRHCCLWFVDVFQQRVMAIAKHQEQSTLQAELTVETWTPGLQLLNDTCRVTRLSFASTLIHFLSIVHEKKSLSKYRRGNVTFLNSLLKRLYAWLSMDDVRVEDAKAVYQLLMGALACYGHFGFIRCVPFIFTVQGLAQHPPRIIPPPQPAIAPTDADPLASDDATRDPTPPLPPLLYSRALASLTLEWLLHAAEQLHLPRLLVDLTKVHQERQNKQQDAPFIDWAAPLVRKNNGAQSTKQQDMNDERELKQPDAKEHVVTVWLDRPYLVQRMIAEDKLKDANEQDLQTHLAVEWDSKQYNEHERHLRITSSISRDTKPKLTPDLSPDSWQNHNEDNRQQVISVDNLKGALAAQLLGNSTNHETDESKSASVDIQLHQLLSNLQQDTATTNGHKSLSLVRPPYTPYTS